MNIPTRSGEGKPSVAQLIAAELARIDGYDPEDLNGGLYDVRWGGGASPEPEGDAWNMDYLPKGERIARELERSEALERKHEQSGPVCATLKWLLAHSYLNESGCIEFGPGFNQTRPGILAGMLIDEMHGWNGVCQFCNAGAEMYADGLPTGDACSHCKGKGNVNELRKEDIYDYYEALSERAAPPSEQSEPVGEVVVTRDAAGAIVAVTRQDSEGRILSTIATAPPPSEQAGISEEVVERAAKAVYDAFVFVPGCDGMKEKPAWAERGNSFKQSEARRYARVALQSAFPRGVGSGEPAGIEAWCAIVSVLDEVSPGWFLGGPQTPVEFACDAIRKLAHPAPEAQAEKPVAEIVPACLGVGIKWHVKLTDLTAGAKLYLRPQPSMSEKPSQNGDTPSASETPSAANESPSAKDALFAFPGDAISHVYRAVWDAERNCYVSIDPPMVTHPMQQPVGHVRKHTGEFKDMAIIVWTNEQPPEGAALYLGPSAHTAEVNEPYPYRWRKPGQRWQYMRHPNREAFNEVMRDLKECGFEVERTGDFDAAIAAQRKEGE